MDAKNVDFKAKIREVMDFPTPGIHFKDITPLLEDKETFRASIDGLADFFRDEKIDKVVGIDARGFLLAAGVAYILNAGMVIVRKKGKLPWEKILREHDLEYGKGSLEMHIDSIKKGERVLVIDDVLATGGTAEAAIKLSEHFGGNIIGAAFLLELPLGGREKLAGYKIESLIKY
ncbi:MAG: adenine phosphoribosyltransferase [bacterium]|nr:adenine phosphoribosyltransferase [bacterium]